MNWKKILNYAKDAALIGAGTALAGPLGPVLGGAIGGAIGGATGRGRPKLKNVLTGAGAGALGGGLVKGAGGVKNLFTAQGLKGGVGKVGSTIAKGAKAGGALKDWSPVITGGLGMIQGMRESDIASRDAAEALRVQQEQFAKEFAQRQAEFEREMMLREEEARRRKEEEEYGRRLRENSAARVNEYLSPFLTAMGNRA